MKELTALSHGIEGESGEYAFGALGTITRDFNIGASSTTTSLTSLGNFSNLRSIGGNFAVRNNRALTTIGDFSALTTIGGNITIQGNPMLSDCSGLPAAVIDKVRDASRTTAVISGNALGCVSITLTTQAQVTAFGTALGTATIFNNNITINEDSDDATLAITDLSVFSNLTQIRGNLFVSSTKSLTTLSHETSDGSGEYAFGALDTITGNFRVGTSSTTTSLTSMGTFPNLRNVGGGFLISNNDTLHTLSGFPVLTTIGEDFRVGGPESDFGNDILTTLEGFSALTTVGGNISIGNNPKLSDCGGLPTRVIDHVEDAGRVASISNNAVGCNISATLTLRRQTDVDDLSLEDATLFIGDITIEESSASPNPITDLSAFSNITEIRGNLVVLSTKSLDTLSHEIGTSGEYAFGALEKITGDFFVGDFGFITTLTNIGNFPNLSSIEGNFAVRNNRDLTTIDADNFPALATIGGKSQNKN